jgi:hypothetical protein
MLQKQDVGDTDWNHLAKDRDEWQPLVNTVADLRIP